MQKRSAMIGSNFFLETGIGEGTRVTINLPILQEPQVLGKRGEKGA